MKAILALLPFFLSLGPSAFAQDCSYSNVYQNHLSAKRELNYWYERYRKAPYGSWEQKRALERVGYVSRNHHQYLRDSELRFESFVCMAKLGNEAYQSYRQSPYNSSKQHFYKEVSRLVYEGGQRALRRELRQTFGQRQWVGLADQGENYYRGYRQSPYNSMKQNFYRGSAAIAFEFAVKKVRRLSQRPGVRFMRLERLGLKAYDRYRKSSYNSLPQKKYRESAKLAFHAAQRKFRRRAKSMGYGRLDQLQARYHQQYRQAPYNSMKQNHFRAMRDIARAHMGH